MISQDQDGSLLSAILFYFFPEGEAACQLSKAGRIVGRIHGGVQVLVKEVGEAIETAKQKGYPNDAAYFLRSRIRMQFKVLFNGSFHKAADLFFRGPVEVEGVDFRF